MADKLDGSEPTFQAPVVVNGAEVGATTIPVPARHTTIPVPARRTTIPVPARRTIVPVPAREKYTQVSVIISTTVVSGDDSSSRSCSRSQSETPCMHTSPLQNTQPPTQQAARTEAVEVQQQTPPLPPQNFIADACGKVTLPAEAPLAKVTTLEPVAKGTTPAVLPDLVSQGDVLKDPLTTGTKRFTILTTPLANLGDNSVTVNGKGTETFIVYAKHKSYDSSSCVRDTTNLASPNYSRAVMCCQTRGSASPHGYATSVYKYDQQSSTSLFRGTTWARQELQWLWSVVTVYIVYYTLYS